MQKFDAAYFRVKNYLEDDGTQNYLVFQPVQKYFKATDALDNDISSWKFKGLPDEEIKSFTVFGVSTAPSLTYIGNRMTVKFEGDLKQDKVT